MIVWVASYPRSGNTLVRMILARAFGCLSASEYPEDAAGATPDPTTAEAAASIGLAYHLRRDAPWEGFCAAARAAADPVLIKTHGPPPDGSRAIYVVRDGRAAVASFVHFLRHYGGKPDMPVAAVIRGAGGFGSWSQHLDSWSPLERRETLLLRFEDLARRPERAIAAMARFLGREPVAAWRNPFDRLQQIVPRFFRHGSDAAGISELTAADLALFWERHGGWMARLGYGSPA